MQATPAKIIEYFNGEKQNLIPLFQRPYTWDKPKWQTLWEDVMVQYDQQEGEGSHFLGTIVSAPARSVPVGVAKFLIIDGQQRLTTFAILLCALRDCVGDQESQRIQNIYLTNLYRPSEDTLKLVPTQADRNAYHDLVIDRKAPPNGPLLCKAYHYFLEQLKTAKDSDDNPVLPNRVLVALERTLQVVMINLDETDDAYLVFESLNSKGEPLTQADLVRNYLLMRFKHSAKEGGEQEAVYNKFWKPLEETHGQELTEFLRHYMMRGGEDLRKGNIYAAVKKRMNELESTDDVKEETRSMDRFGAFYARIFNPGLESSPLIRWRLENFKQLLAMSTSYPLLLRLLDARDRGVLSEAELEKCFGIIESFTVRRSVCNVPTNALNKLYLQWCKDLPDENHAEWLRAAMSKGGSSRRFPNNSEFGDFFQNQAQYAKGLTRFILDRLEGSFQHKEPIHLSIPTIEHIMPQTLTPAWEEELRDGDDKADPKAIHAQLVNTFGNLTLTGYNSEMGNQPFAEKRERLRQSHLELSRAVAACSHWRTQEIKMRAEDLFKRALKIWPGPVSTDE